MCKHPGPCHAGTCACWDDNLNPKYVVGTVKRYETKGWPIIYYRDTRGETGHGRHSDIFTSSSNLQYASQYSTVEEAEAWANEFINRRGFTAGIYDTDGNLVKLSETSPEVPEGDK